jgi:hypothetical protein
VTTPFPSAVSCSQVPIIFSELNLMEGRCVHTADFAILVTRLFGSSKLSIPSETRSCCACAEMGPVFVSFRGMGGKS